MKATEPGISIGRAMSNFDGNSVTGTVIVFVNIGWYNGNGTATSFGANPTQLSVQTDASNIGPITASSTLDMAGQGIINIASLKGLDNKWTIDETGNFTIKGEIVKQIETSAGTKDFYPVYNGDPTMMLSGSGEILNGEARIMFDPALSEIMDPAEPLKVTVTMTSEGAQGLYVAEKSIADILVKEINAGKGSARFDYIIIAKRKINGLSSSVSSATSTAPITTTSTLPISDGISSSTPTTTSTTSTPVVTPVIETTTSTPEASPATTTIETIIIIPVIDIVTPTSSVTSTIL